MKCWACEKEAMLGCTVHLSGPQESATFFELCGPCRTRLLVIAEERGLLENGPQWSVLGPGKDAMNQLRSEKLLLKPSPDVVRSIKGKYAHTLVPPIPPTTARPEDIEAFISALRESMLSSPQVTINRMDRMDMPITEFHIVVRHGAETDRPENLKFGGDAELVKNSCASVVFPDSDGEPHTAPAEPAKLLPIPILCACDRLLARTDGVRIVVECNEGRSEPIEGRVELLCTCGRKKVWEPSV